jgi:hypothetical protein
MTLPFTSDQFFEVFAAFNRAFLFWIVLLWFVCLVTVVWVARRPEFRSPALSVVLGGLWAWNAVSYHALFFSRINPAAWLFAAAFGVQAILFFRAARARRVDYFEAAGWTGLVGSGLVVYAFAYPFLTMAFGQRYPTAPLFGVPCPTALLTIGALLTARGGVPRLAAVVPVLWAFVGGSAAVLFGVAADYMLPAAGLLLLLAAVAPRPVRSHQGGMTAWPDRSTR